MTHAIIREKNGRRHEVDFGDSLVRIEVYASEETIEIFVEADFEMLPEERRRFAIINVPRQQFSQATGEAPRRAAKDGAIGKSTKNIRTQSSTTPRGNVSLRRTMRKPMKAFKRHIPLYVAGLQFRQNNRDNADIFAPEVGRR